MVLLLRIWAGGGATAALGAIVIGLIGGTGRDGLAVLLLLLALTAVVAGLAGTIGLVRDDLGDRRISSHRIMVVMGSFFGSALLMAMLTGAGG